MSTPNYQNTDIFSERLAALMRGKPVTQKKLAEAVGVSQGSVSGWLNGTIPGAMELFKIAQFFEVPMESLLTDPYLHIRAAKAMADVHPGSQEEKQAEFERVVRELLSWKERAINAERKLAQLGELLSQGKSESTESARTQNEQIKGMPKQKVSTKETLPDVDPKVAGALRNLQPVALRKSREAQEKKPSQKAVKPSGGKSSPSEGTDPHHK